MSPENRLRRIDIFSHRKNKNRKIPKRCMSDQLNRFCVNFWGQIRFWPTHIFGPFRQKSKNDLKNPLFLALLLTFFRLSGKSNLDDLVKIEKFRSFTSATHFSSLSQNFVDLAKIRPKQIFCQLLSVRVFRPENGLNRLRTSK